MPDDALVTVPHPDQRRRQRRLACHVATLAAEDVRALRGLRLTSPERLFVDFAARSTLVDLVVLGDWLVRRGYTQRDSLRQYIDRFPGRHARSARRAAELVRDDVDSPMETRLRPLIVLAGLPEPVVDLRIRDHSGAVVMRLDLCWPEHRLAVEYDGRHHVERISQWERDHDRRDALENDGWRLLVVTSKGIYREPEVTLDRIRRALQERGVAVGVLDDDWRRHFR